jgi:hypothetical protein
MGNILHANAKTTPRIRKEIQNATASIAALAKHYKLNPKTVIRWKNTNSVTDKKSGPKVRKSVLTLVEQQAICEVRRCLVPYNNMIKYNNLSIGELWGKYFTGVLRQPRKLEIKSNLKKELLIPLPGNIILAGIPQRNGKAVITLPTNLWAMVEAMPS